MDLVALDHVVDHGRVSSEARSGGQNSKDIQQLQLILLGHYVLEEVPDPEDDKDGVHEAGDTHSDPSQHKLTLMAGHVEIQQHLHSFDAQKQAFSVSSLFHFLTYLIHRHCHRYHLITVATCHDLII